MHDIASSQAGTPVPPQPYFLCNIVFFPFIFVTLFAVVLLAFAGCGQNLSGPDYPGNRENTAQPESEITVGAAASLTDVLQAIVADYSAGNPGVKVFLSLGASSTIARQIQTGSPVDVFFSADSVQMDQLEKSGLILEGTRVELLSNRLAFVTSGKNWQERRSFEDLMKNKDTVIALCDTSVPIGRYSKDYLTKIGLYGDLVSRAIILDNARALLAAVDSGNADLALVFETDARAAKSARIVKTVSTDEGPFIVYQVAVIKKTKHVKESQDFLYYLQSPNALQRFTQAGFLAIKAKN